ncbi:MAG: class I SAM-dependent methyltransferase [Gloeomargarita sp. SKYG116]|nr:class I SAM-dependent methyltransferase [Gloeomargarita sp. SKYG116]MDW8401906.1 class I SAM-dependent methyltransferase [Gloeomargarita sp. SKYGB_i_bin116]
MFDDILARERAFHDAWAKVIDTDEIPVVDYFTACTAPENRFILSHLGDMRGKSVLDLGCGAGENSVYFALRGANCIAADYAPEMLNVAQKLADQYGVTIGTKVVNAMAIDFPDNTFDIVYAANLLHHLPDPLLALQEMRRVVKPGGHVCFWDPLIHNPIINVYRRLATQVRTPDERPLSINIIRHIRPLFRHIAWDTFWLATLWIFLQFYFIEKVNPNRERYWKKIIAEHRRLQPLYTRLEKVDHWLKHLPGLKCWAWNLAVVAIK